MSDTTRYFRLLDHVGVEPEFKTDPETGQPVPSDRAGELQPLHVLALTIQKPVMVAGEVVGDTQVVYVKPYDAAARVLATDDPVIANVIAGLGTFEEVDPPSKRAARDVPKVEGLAEGDVVTAAVAAELEASSGAQPASDAPKPASTPAPTSTTPDTVPADPTPAGEED